MKRTENILNEIKKLCDNIKYSHSIPPEAEQLAKDNNIVVIVGASDDLMYCLGAKCYLTDRIEHEAGWNGEDLTKSDNELLRLEAEQLGLKIFWCGEIENTGEIIENYDVKKDGAFSYSVNDNIKALDFKVIDEDEVYCTGKIIQLPNNFKRSLLKRKIK